MIIPFFCSCKSVNKTLPFLYFLSPGGVWKLFTKKKEYMAREIDYCIHSIGILSYRWLEIDWGKIIIDYHIANGSQCILKETLVEGHIIHISNLYYVCVILNIPCAFRNISYAIKGLY